LPLGFGSRAPGRCLGVPAPWRRRHRGVGRRRGARVSWRPDRSDADTGTVALGPPPHAAQRRRRGGGRSATYRDGNALAEQTEDRPWRT
jgi:hypothetical protein